MDITKEQVLAFLKSQYREGDIVIKIIIANLGIYLSLKLIHFIEWVFRLSNLPFSSFINNWLYLSFDFKTVLAKFYTLLSYQFIHDDLLHLVINLILLYFFGKLLLQLIGLRKFLPLYLLGGLFGGVLFVILSSTQVVPITAKPMIGASASIMALMGATAFLLPDYSLKFFLVFDVKLKWLVLGFGLLNLLSIFSPEGSGSGIVHFAGLIFGLGYMYLDSKGIGIAIAAPFNKALDYVTSLFNKKPKVKVTYVNPNKRKGDKKQVTKTHQVTIDAILDKISSDGYESLNKEEKDFLFKASK